LVSIGIERKERVIDILTDMAINRFAKAILHRGLKRIGPAELGVHHDETNCPINLSRHSELVLSTARL
jgi:hypothetical protein